MGEIVLGFWDFILLLIGIVLFILLIYIILYEYKNWRTRRLIKVTKPVIENKKAYIDKKLLNNFNLYFLVAFNSSTITKLI